MFRRLPIIFASVLALLLAALLLFSPAQPPVLDDTTGDQLDATAIPDQQLVSWLIKAGALCQHVSAPLLAAQLQQESGFRPHLTSSAGAQGYAQFLPATFAAIAQDDDNNGRTNPNDRGDAVMAQGRYMCQIADQVKTVPGDRVGNILAGYNAGPGAVLRYHGIPPYPETQNYVKTITANITKFTAASTSSAAGSSSRGCIAPVNAPAGTPLGVAGPAWHWFGKHTGLDYLATTGQRVVAACSGRIAAKGSSGAYGNHLYVSLGNVDGVETTMLYAHLSAFAAGVSTGDTVKTGQYLGNVGATGNAFGPHLHFEVIRGDGLHVTSFGQFIDPPTWLKAHSGPPRPGPGDTGRTVPAAALAGRAINAAKSQLGTAYVFGAGGYTGPTGGGFDCSSLIQYAWYQASDRHIRLPRVTTQQINSTKLAKITNTDRQPGDLIFYSLHRASWDHVGMYTGDNKMIHAPRTGKPVQIVDISTGYYAHATQATRRVITP